MGLKNERLWGFGDMKALWERRGFGNLVVNNRREAEIEDEDMGEWGSILEQRIPERGRKQRVKKKEKENIKK
jgi:hypothetical protein